MDAGVEENRSNFQFLSNKDSINRYRSRRGRTRNFLRNARNISFNEINEATQSVLQNPKYSTVIQLVKTLTNSGVWVSHSLVRYLHGLVDFEISRYKELSNQKVKDILKMVASGSKIKSPTLSLKDFFRAIFLERSFLSSHPDYKEITSIPEVKATLVFVDGILNEVFSAPMFERTLKTLQNKKNINYFIPKIDGLKGVKNNANSLRKQLDLFIQQNPKQKLWLVGFSKGGLDAIHFLWENPHFSNSHILGLSTIATPILGSNRFNQGFVKYIKSLHRLSHKPIYRKFSKKGDFLFKNTMEYMNSENQTPWFRKNYEGLPNGLFYTALALEAEWYESHLWMIMAKILFPSKDKNDGIVDFSKAQFPQYFDGINFGLVRGHHLIGTRSSFYSQEAVLETHLILLNYLGLIH